MRGVYLPAGKHVVEFRFQPPLKLLWVSLTALALGLLLTAILVLVPKQANR
jgi:hypothetical protein